MASLIYTSVFDDMAEGRIDIDAPDTFKVMLLTSTYTPNKDHAKRSDLTNEVSGTGYTAGGNAATVTSTLDTANDRVDIALGGTSWSTATITARYAAYYKSRGGASTADE
jgi:hypothetical protein